MQMFLDWQFNLFQARRLAKFYLCTQTVNTVNLYVMLDFMPKMTIFSNFSLISGNLSGIKSSIKYVLTFEIQ